MTVTRLWTSAASCAALALPLMADPACTRMHECGLVGCVDEAAIDLESPTGAWAPGGYQFALVIDGNTANCAIQIPASPPPATRIAGSCTSEITLTFLAQEQCAASPSDGSADASSSDPNSAQGETCSPIPGHFHQTLTLVGTPHDVALSLKRDDHSIVDQTVTLSYATTQPNGPGCDPTCHQASSVITIADDTGDAGNDATPPRDAAASE